MGEGRDRPAQHGAVVGKMLSAMEAIGREFLPDLPPSCLTCAFRKDSAPNLSPGVALTAFKCAMGTDPDAFACHHGMEDNWPTKLCAGYYAARHAFEHAFPRVRELTLQMGEDLNALGERDELRASFDAWLAEVDPEGKMDAYEFARAYAKHAPTTHGGGKA